jgi:quercetin dioxygenase-like cupin family protein
MKESKDWITNEDIGESYLRGRVFIMLENKILGYKLKNRLARVWRALKNRSRRVKFKIQLGMIRTRRVLRWLVPGDENEGRRIASQVFPIRIPLPPDVEKGWKSYPVFKGPTKILHELSCSVSVLMPNHCPHAPHRHKEEEILLLFSGELDLILPDLHDMNKSPRMQLKPGHFAYYPSHFTHTIQTISEAPANYLIFKWQNDLKKYISALGFGSFHMFDHLGGSEVKKGFSIHLVFEGRTSCLQKLQCHTSTLTPGAGYEPHIDAYDVAIIVLEGEVETLGKRVGPQSVIFYASGVPHGMSNPGETVAKYIVFEFHNQKKGYR